MNLRPSGYEPDELPGCSIPRYSVFRVLCPVALFVRLRERGCSIPRYSVFRVLCPVALFVRLRERGCSIPRYWSRSVRPVARFVWLGLKALRRGGLHEPCYQKHKGALFESAPFVVGVVVVRVAWRPVSRSSEGAQGDDASLIRTYKTWRRPTLPRLETKYHWR